MKIKKILALVLVAILLVSCGPKEGEKPEAGQVEDNSKVEAEVKDDSGDQADAELEKITFVLDWTPNTNHTGVFVAKDKGYYEEMGLEVEIVQPPEDGAEVLVGSGKAEFGVSFQDFLPPVLTGDGKMPVKAVATILQHNTSGIMSRKGEGMDRPKGMEGQRYASWQLPVELATLKQVIENDGGDFEKVEIIPSTVTDEVSALKTNSVDALWVYYGWAGIAAEVAGLETDYFDFKDIDPVFDYYSPVIISNENFLEEKPEIAKKFLEATRKGYEFAIEDPEAAAEILLANDSSLPEDLVMASQKWISEEYKAEVERWGYMDPARWNGFYNWLNENDLVEEKLEENIGFTNDYLPE